LKQTTRLVSTFSILSLINLSLILPLLLSLLLSACSGSDGDTTDGKKTGTGKVTAKTIADPSPTISPRVIYGDDNRLDLYDVKDPARLILADATVAVILSSDLTTAGDRTNIRTTKFGDDFELPLCPTERFREQGTVAFCSGFLIAPDIIATAGHCMPNSVGTSNPCAQTRFVFGFGLTSPNKDLTSVPTSQVYGCKKIIKREQLDNAQDYAVVELDRPVADHMPLKLRQSGDPALTDELMVIGYPYGLPTKVADGGRIRSVNNFFLVASLDTYGGNSGSAVFNTRTNEVEGILVRGEEDFVAQNKCLASNRCPQNGCRGEDATRISYVLPYVK